jgi:hypothetical protein
MMSNKPRTLLSRRGCYLAGAYVLIVIVVFALTAATTKPGNAGLDWIPFLILAWPWPWIAQGLLLPGLIVNTALMYMFGMLSQRLLHTLRHSENCNTEQCP